MHSTSHAERRLTGPRVSRAALGLAVFLAGCGSSRPERPAGDAGAARAPGEDTAAVRRDAPSTWRDPSLDRALLAALREGDATGARELLERGADPEAADEEGTPALILAAVSGDLPLVDALLERGARVDRPAPTGQTALSAAVIRRQVEVARRLLERGAPTDPPGAPLTPLMIACGSGSREQLPLVEMLLAAGAKVDARDESGRTPLMYAAGKIRLATVQRLIDAGADVRLRDNAGRSVLFYLSGEAEREERDKIAAFLRARGAVD